MEKLNFAKGVRRGALPEGGGGGPPEARPSAPTVKNGPEPGARSCTPPAPGFAMPLRASTDRYYFLFRPLFA